MFLHNNTYDIVTHCKRRGTYFIIIIFILSIDLKFFFSRCRLITVRDIVEQKFCVLSLLVPTDKKQYLLASNCNNKCRNVHTFLHIMRFFVTQKYTHQQKLHNI